MFDKTFYHQTIRRAVAVFGTVFNDISIIRRDASGKVLNIVKVPLAYGPKQKFLARIEQQNSLESNKVAIKLPRVSFEITSLTYDAQSKIQKGYYTRLENSPDKKMIGPVDYLMGMQLNIMAKNQDDALQILEQIVPYFQPDYGVTVKQVGSEKTDMMISLESVNMSDDYEGDYSTRRAIIYSLDFMTKVRFYGPIEDNSVIKRVILNLEGENEYFTGIGLTVEPFSSSEDDNYTVDVKYFGNQPDSVILTLDNTGSITSGQLVYGATSASSGVVTSVAGQDVTVKNTDGLFENGESLTTGAVILDLVENYDE